VIAKLTKAATKTAETKSDYRLNCTHLS